MTIAQLARGITSITMVKICSAGENSSRGKKFILVSKKFTPVCKKIHRLASPAQYIILFFPSNVHFWHILVANIWSDTSLRLFEFIHFSMNLNGIFNECNLNEIKFHKHFSWDSPLRMVNNGDYFFTLLFCHWRFLLLTSSKLAGLTNLSFSL